MIDSSQIFFTVKFFAANVDSFALADVRNFIVKGFHVYERDN